MSTNGSFPNETEAALVVWVSRAFPQSVQSNYNPDIQVQVNSFPLSNHVNSLGEMNDGQAFWEMLRTYCPLEIQRCMLNKRSLGEINPEAFTGDLPSRKRSDYARQQNCKSLQS